jgi:hypothetical protein
MFLQAAGDISASERDRKTKLLHILLARPGMILRLLRICKSQSRWENQRHD